MTGNNVGFHFPTGVTNGQYNVNVFLQPTSQTQGCSVFFIWVWPRQTLTASVDCQRDMTGHGCSDQILLAHTATTAPRSFRLRLLRLQITTRLGEEIRFHLVTIESEMAIWRLGTPQSGFDSAIPAQYFGRSVGVFAWRRHRRWQNYGIWVPADIPTTKVLTPQGVTTVTASTVPLQVPGTDSRLPNSTTTYTDLTTGNIITNYVPAVPGITVG